MKMHPLEFRAFREPYALDAIAIYISQRVGDSVAYAESITFRKVPESARLDPVLRIEPGQAQQLMDELWRAGIRPTDGAGSVGQLAATERHLEDMRKLVFEGRKV